MTKIERSAAISITIDLVRAKSENDFEKLTQHLKENACEEFFVYFESNWINCKNKWVHAYRQNLPTLGNNTNNRIESLNHKLKKFLNTHLHLPQALNQLMKYIKYSEHSSAANQYRELKTAINTKSFSQIHLDISSVCTSAAAELLFLELDLMQTNEYEVSL